MKMSVIFGVLHMNFGVLIKGTNAIFRANWPIFFCEVIAGLVILNGLFGWMDLLIFVKWMHPANIYNWKDVGTIYCATDINGNTPLLVDPKGANLPSNWISLADPTKSANCPNNYAYYYS
jgi:hypothetical protein